MRDVVETEHNIRIPLRREVVWEERISVVDDQDQRSLHLVGAEQSADGFVFFVLVVGFTDRVLTGLGMDTLGFPATDGTSTAVGTRLLVTNGTALTRGI